MNEPKINLISEKKANLIVSTWLYDKGVNRELYLANGKDCYICIDNSYGACCVEHFKTIKEAIEWLLDNEESEDTE